MDRDSSLSQRDKKWNTARAVSRAARQIVCRRRVRRVQQISSRHGWWVGHSTRPLCPLAQKGTDGEKHPPRQQAPPYRKAIWPPCRKRDLDLTMADGGEQPGFGKESLELEGGWSSKVPSTLEFWVWVCFFFYLIFFTEKHFILNIAVCTRQSQTFFTLTDL